MSNPDLSNRLKGDAKKIQIPKPGFFEFIVILIKKVIDLFKK